MGLKKPQNYSQSEISTALFGRAIAHPVRVKLINILRNHRLTLKEIGNIVNLSPTAVRNHISMLNDVGLLLPEYQTHFISYSLNEQVYKKACAEFLQQQILEEECLESEERADNSPMRKLKLIQFIGNLIGILIFILPLKQQIQYGTTVVHAPASYYSG